MTSVGQAKRVSTPLSPLPTDTFNLRFGQETAAPIAPTVNETDLATLEQWVQNAGATDGFAQNIRTFIQQTVSSPMLRDIRHVPYQVQVKNNIRQNRPELYEDCDYTGGFHERKDNRISIAEKIWMLPNKKRPYGEWQSNLFWKNAVIHEFGHAIGYILGQKEANRLQAEAPNTSVDQQTEYRFWGVSESPLIRAAWEADFKALPEEIRKQASSGLEKCQVGYFLMREVRDGMLTQNFAPGRQEVFAEAFDILHRGEASSYNYANFVKYFPNMLRAVRQTVEDAYGVTLPARDVVS